MDYKLTYNNLPTFTKNVYRCHCWIREGNQKEYENTIILRGFPTSTFEQCLLRLLSEQYDLNLFDFNIVTDIANKVIILTIKGKHYLRLVTIDKLERIQDIED